MIPAAAAVCLGVYLVVSIVRVTGAGGPVVAVLAATETPVAVMESSLAEIEVSTVEPSPTPTRTSTPTATPVPSSTPTVSPSPTDTPVPTGTPTPIPTNTPEPLPVISLISPEEGTRFQGKRTRVILQWEPAGPLGDDDWYGVSLRYWADGAVQYAGAWVKETSWLVPKELHGKPDPREPGFRWDVTLMRQTGTKEGGGREGVALSETSETREFFWD